MKTCGVTTLIGKENKYHSRVSDLEALLVRLTNNILVPVCVQDGDNKEGIQDFGSWISWRNDHFDELEEHLRYDS
jgi:hypothetical protein